jgi:hypothetical protein
LVNLIDKTFDEFVLYILHYQRQKNHLTTGVYGLTPGYVLTNDIAHIVPSFLHARIARNFKLFTQDSFDDHQNMKLPYLFSIAPPGSRPQNISFTTPICTEEMPGFPETWTLLNNCFKQLLIALENIFSVRSTIFGQWTLADSSVFGQLNGLLKYDKGNYILIHFSDSILFGN